MAFLIILLVCFGYRHYHTDQKSEFEFVFLLWSYDHSISHF